VDDAKVRADLRRALRHVPTPPRIRADEASAAGTVAPDLRRFEISIEGSSSIAQLFPATIPWHFHSGLEGSRTRSRGRTRAPKAAHHERVRLTVFGASHTQVTSRGGCSALQKYGDIGHGFVFPAAIWTATAPRT
jgi:hypothetical protein